MQQGFWNFTEPVQYRVLNVEFLPVPETLLHWQNAFVGQTGQVLEINYAGKSFYIDNRDGSGLRKIEAGGGPNSMSRHVGSMVVLGELQEKDWQAWDPAICEDLEKKVVAWQKANHPEEFKKLQALKDAWNNSDYKKMVDKARKHK
jgi:hypothetical protein